MTAASDGVGVHIVRPTRAGILDEELLNVAARDVLKSKSPVRVTAGAGWTHIELHITRDQFVAAGAPRIETLFVRMSDLAGAHFARTQSGGDWARVADGELAGVIDALDWLQYFGTKYGDWLRGRSKLLTKTQSPRGAQVVKLDLDPLAPSWVSRERAATDIYLRLRAMPASAGPELDPETRLKKVLPPAAAGWKPEQAQAMNDARARTLAAIKEEMGDAPLFDAFRDRYLSGDRVARLDTVATWLPHYGAAAAGAAFRAVARMHNQDPAGAALDDTALEGCVKIVSWGGDDRPLPERERLMEHVVTLAEPGIAAGMRAADDRDSVAGLLKMTAMMTAACKCERCAETRSILGGGQS